MTKSTLTLKRTENVKYCVLHPAVQAAMAKKIKDLNEIIPPPPPKKKKGEFHGRRNNGTVDPITDPNDIQAAKNYFLSQSERYQSNSTSIRNYALFVTSCNCARRIGDVLKLKISDVLNDDFSFKPRIVIKEEKTNKPARVWINIAMQEALSLYFNSLENLKLDDYIFKSRDGENKPITTRSAWRIYKDMSRAIGLDKKGINVGTHSARKTWAYNALKADPTNPEQILVVQEALNHSNISVTRKYCGLTQEKMDNVHMSVVI